MSNLCKIYTYKRKDILIINEKSFKKNNLVSIDSELSNLARNDKKKSGQPTGLTVISLEPSGYVNFWERKTFTPSHCNFIGYGLF